MSGALLVAMAVVHRFGGWKSTYSAWAWLKAEPKWLFLIVSAPIIIVGLAFVSSDTPPYNHVLAYAIEAFFFAYAFIAAGRSFWSAGVTSIASWFRG